MAAESNVQFHFSIWRNRAPANPSAFLREDGSFEVITEEHRFSTQVYTWPMQQDYLAGVSKEETRNRLRELLDELAASRPLGQRSLGVLEEFVAEAERAISNGEAAPVPSSLGDTTILSSPLLALVLHLTWIIQCFKDRPGISVVKR